VDHSSSVHSPSPHEPGVPMSSGPELLVGPEPESLIGPGPVVGGVPVLLD
jgi:hypothetical protein